MPIDIATGHVEIDRLDFSIPGRYPVLWERRFRSELLSDGGGDLARGWLSPFTQSLHRAREGWLFTDTNARQHVFLEPKDELQRGKTIRLLGAYLELSLHRNRYRVRQWNVDTGEVHCYLFAPTSSGLAMNLLSVENCQGDGIDLTWDLDGKLTSFKQRTEQRLFNCNYTTSGRLRSINLGDLGFGPPLISYEYDAHDRLVAAVNRKGLAHRYEYDENHRLRREHQPGGSAFMYRYDDRGRCTYFTGQDRYNEKHLRFLDEVGTTILTDSYGSQRIFKCLPNGQIASETSAIGATKTSHFDDHGRLISQTDEVGATTSYTYDREGNRDSITDPLGNSMSYEFNEAHLPIAFQDALGKRWERTYDSNYRLSSTCNPLGERWLLDYDESGNLMHVVDPIGNVRTFRFEKGMVRSATDFMGNTTEYEWDAIGQMTQRKDALGAVTRFRYDLAGNLVGLENPDGTKIHASFDSANNLNCIVNATGFETHFTYGPCKRLIQRRDPTGRTISYQWGTEPGRLESIENQAGDRLIFVYDAAQRVISETTFGGRTTHFAYDAADRCIASLTVGMGRVTYDRDLLGRLIRQTLPTGDTAQFAYDASGKLVAAHNSDSNVEFEYDAVGRLTKETQDDFWIATEYDRAGDVLRVVTSLEHSVSYELNPNGRITSLTTHKDSRIVFERNAVGQELVRKLPNRMELIHSYDSMGRLISQDLRRASNAPPSTERAGISASSGKVSRMYSYDSNGCLKTISDSCWGTTQYDYDPADRILRNFRNGSLSEVFDYDSRDNVVRQRSIVANQSIEIDRHIDSGNCLRRLDDKTIEYDEDGFQTSVRYNLGNGDTHRWKYEWNALGQLTSVIRPDGEKWEYTYDALGRRISKSSSGSSKRFAWNGDSLIHEIEGDSAIASWICIPNTLTPIARIRNGRLETILTDHLGTPREVVSDLGEVIWQTSLTTWGAVAETRTTDPGAHCSIRFPGQYHDEESGLHYNRFRYYSPEQGRYVSPDPIGWLGGINEYRYTKNPVSSSDPYGLNDCSDPASKEGLARQLASEEQLAQVMTGGGVPIAGAGTSVVLRDAPRLAAVYGGAPTDWAKVRSNSSADHGIGLPSGGNFETHAYQNMSTGQVVEPKLKIDGH